MPRKIKVVDVVDSDNNEAVGESAQQPELVQENNEQTDTVDASTNDEIQSAETKEEVKQTAETDKHVEEANKAPATKVRTNELHECPKCGKFMTLKTLKYTHEKTCGIVREPPPKKEKPAPKPRGRPKKEIYQPKQKK